MPEPVLGAASDLADFFDFAAADGFFAAVGIGFDTLVFRVVKKKKDWGVLARCDIIAGVCHFWRSSRK